MHDTRSVQRGCLSPAVLKLCGCHLLSLRCALTATFHAGVSIAGYGDGAANQGQLFEVSADGCLLNALAENPAVWLAKRCAVM